MPTQFAHTNEWKDTHDLKNGQIKSKEEEWEKN